MEPFRSAVVKESGSTCCSSSAPEVVSEVKVEYCATPRPRSPREPTTAPICPIPINALKRILWKLISGDGRRPNPTRPIVPSREVIESTLSGAVIATEEEEPVEGEERYPMTGAASKAMN